MLQSLEETMELNQALFWIAQVNAPAPQGSLDDAALAFSGPQFVIAIISGVILAFGFQILLTNLGVAAGISFLGGSSQSKKSQSQSSSQSSQAQSGSSGGTIRKIGMGVGLATLVTATITLFAACILAVQLSLIESAGLGAIVGLVIWALYFCLLVWFSSTKIGSLVGSVVNTATSSFQALFGTATAALGGIAAKKQAVATAEASAKASARAVRRELSEGLDPQTVRENLEDYLGSLRSPEVDTRGIRRDLENMLSDERFERIARSEAANEIDRQTFVNLVRSRSDLSEREVSRVADELEAVWNKKVRQSRSQSRMEELGDYLNSAPRSQLMGEELTRRLDVLVEELRLWRESRSSEQQSPLGERFTNRFDDLVEELHLWRESQTSSGQSRIARLRSQAMSYGFNSLKGVVTGRTDLSNFDVEKILSKLQGAKEQLNYQTSRVTARLGGGSSEESLYSIVRADVENYLLHTLPGRLKNGETLPGEFREVIYDPEADPKAVAGAIEQLDRAYFVELLQQRGLLTQGEIRRIADSLEEIRTAALADAREAQKHTLFQAVESYLLTTPKEELTPEKIQLNFRPILEDPEADYELLSDRLTRVNRPTLEHLLYRRGDLIPPEVTRILPELEKARDQVLAEAEKRQEAAKAKAEAQWLRLASYLRNTGKAELSPEGIQQDLQTLLDDPQAGVAAIRERTSRFDRDTLVQLLNQREDLSQEQINQIVDQVEANWNRVRYTPQRLAGRAKEQYEQAIAAIAEYLRSTGKEELNPEGIQQDLKQLFDDRQAGTQAIRQRLAEVDRDTLVQLLAGREDLSEEQVNRVIDQVQQTLYEIANAPRRLATRAQTQVLDFESALEDYLRNTDKEELNPDGIKRDLQQLLNQPGVGISRLSDRLAQIDRSTVIALLSQREDISEEEAARSVDRILSVRDQFLYQLERIQQRIQSAIDTILERIRSYLDSLERPELDYEGIKQDLRQLFEEPKAGFEALRDRLSQINLETLRAILQSRKDLTEVEVNRIMNQIEQTRNRVLQRSERIQKETQRRLEQAQQQAQKQAEETRKSAMAASWWLFLTAFVSGGASAIAGALAVAG